MNICQYIHIYFHFVSIGLSTVLVLVGRRGEGGGGEEERAGVEVKL